MGTQKKRQKKYVWTEREKAKLNELIEDGKSLDEIFQHWENAVASHEESFYPRNRQGIEARINKLESEKKLSGGNNTSVEPLSETSSKWSKVEVEKLNELWNEGKSPQEMIDFWSQVGNYKEGFQYRTWSAIKHKLATQIGSEDMRLFLLKKNESKPELARNSSSYTIEGNAATSATGLDFITRSTHGALSSSSQHVMENSPSTNSNRSQRVQAARGRASPLPGTQVERRETPPTATAATHARRVPHVYTNGSAREPSSTVATPAAEETPTELDPRRQTFTVSKLMEMPKGRRVPHVYTSPESKQDSTEETAIPRELPGEDSGEEDMEILRRISPATSFRGLHHLQASPLGDYLISEYIGQSGRRQANTDISPWLQNLSTIPEHFSGPNPRRYTNTTSYDFVHNEHQRNASMMYTAQQELLPPVVDQGYAGPHQYLPPHPRFQPYPPQPRFQTHPPHPQFTRFHSYRPLQAPRRLPRARNQDPPPSCRQCKDLGNKSGSAATILIKPLNFFHPFNLVSSLLLRRISLPQLCVTWNCLQLRRTPCSNRYGGCFCCHCSIIICSTFCALEPARRTSLLAVHGCS